MKKTLLLSLSFCAAGLAQAVTPTVTLTWEDTLNPAEGTTYSVYRATGLCSGTPVFAKLGTGITAKTYADLTTTAGNYCYTVTATVAGIESAPSNNAGSAVAAFSPVNLTSQVTVPTPATATAAAGKATAQ